jgi:AcrR family transcriptional regulator
MNEENKGNGKDKVRDEILRASQTVFTEKGYQEARLEDIAQQACVSPETLSELFLDKEDLYNQTCRAAIQSWHNWFVSQARMQDDPLASFITLCREAFLFMARDGETREFLQTGPLVFVFSSERFNDITDRGVSILASKLEECVEAGIFRPMDCERMAVTMHEMYKLLILTTYTQPYDRGAEQLFEDLLDLFLHGLLKSATQDPS